jgi:hypothetical protein
MPRPWINSSVAEAASTSALLGSPGAWGEVRQRCHGDGRQEFDEVVEALIFRARLPV